MATGAILKSNSSKFVKFHTFEYTDGNCSCNTFLHHLVLSGIKASRFNCEKCSKPCKSINNEVSMLKLSKFGKQVVSNGRLAIHGLYLNFTYFTRSLFFIAETSTLFGNDISSSKTSSGVYNSSQWKLPLLSICATATTEQNKKTIGTM